MIDLNQKPQHRIGYFPEHSPSQPSEQQKQSSHFSRKRLKGLFSNIHPFRLTVLILCAIVFCTCLFLLSKYTFDLLLSRSASNQLGNIRASVQQQISQASQTPCVPVTSLPVLTPVPATSNTVPDGKKVWPSASEIWPATYASNSILRVSPVFYQLQAQNEDIIGWLKIDGVLDEAVLQRDNEYYLTHNAMKQRSVTGALFLDENCNLAAVPTQMLIHGHNMKDGSMFGSLNKYKTKEASYYHQHPFIDFHTIYENERYVIFAVAEVDIRSKALDYLPFWQYSRFSSAESFMEYVARSKQLSLYNCNIDVKPGDRLLTLSTCTSDDQNKRLVIMARKFRQNENEFELNVNILTTTKR